MYLKRVLKNSVDQFPDIANLYRTLRDELVFHRQKPVRIPLGFWFYGDRSMELGLFEPDETALIMEILEDVDVFIDIGANVGYYSCLARSRGKKVISIEPHPKKNLSH